MCLQLGGKTFFDSVAYASDLSHTNDDFFKKTTQTLGPYFL